MGRSHGWKCEARMQAQFGLGPEENTNVICVWGDFFGQRCDFAAAVSSPTFPSLHRPRHLRRSPRQPPLGQFLRQEAGYKVEEFRKQK